MLVLRGHALVPEQIVAEWLEYQVIFNGLLERFSALLARQAKAEKKRMETHLEPEQLPLQEDRKRQLRSRVAQLHLRGTSALPATPQRSDVLSLFSNGDEDKDP